MNIPRTVASLFINEPTYTILFIISDSPLMTQNPMSIINAFLVIYIDIVIQIRSPTIFILKLVSDSGPPIEIRWYLTLKNILYVHDTNSNTTYGVIMVTLMMWITKANKNGACEFIIPYEHIFILELKK